RKRNIEDELVNWELYKAYGHFNLCFESLIATFRELLIDMVRLSYGFNVDWEDPDTEEPVDDYLQDRLLKIILHDDGAFAIVEKSRSCFFDMTNKEFQKVLSDNDILPVLLPESILKTAELIFKKSLELVKLRNIIIHSHYEGVVFNLMPVRNLMGKKHHKTAKGFEERKYILTVDFLNKLIEQIEDLENLVQHLNYFVTIDIENNGFESDTDELLSKMKFSIPQHI
ncbi:MAG: hypothetical protein ACKVQV_16030, partial [Bacteroidia bacterium]